MIYGIAVKGQIWVRYRNQLRSRLSGRETEEPSLALEVCLDTIGLPTETSTTTIANSEKLTPVEKPSSGLNESERRQTVRF